MRELPYQAHRAPHTRTDPAYAPRAEVFDSLEHDEIHRKVQLLDPAVLNAGGQAWQASATGLGEAVAQAHTEIRAAIADGWRGAAAETAAAAVLAFEQRGQQLADVFGAVAQRLTAAAEAAETLRSAVGEPSRARPDLAAALLDPAQATANIATQKAAENDRQDVVRVMDTIYTGAFLASGTDVPAFPDDADTGLPGMPVAAPSAGAPSHTATGGESVTAQSLTGTTETGGDRPVQSAPPAPATPGPATSAQPTGAGVPVPGSVTAGGGAPATATSTSTATAAAAAPTAPVTPTGVTPQRPTGAEATTPGATAVPAGAGPAATRRKRDDHSTSSTGAAGTAATGHVTGSTATGTAPGGETSTAREHERTSEQVTGAGAGAIGGLIGGAALAAGDTARTGSSVAATAARAERDDDREDDDEFRWEEDDFDFGDEPSGEPDADALIGELDPAAPPVVGEWTERE
ncbi:PPE domain-containing protein [Nocardia farcinica]|uniref:PPE domain-containing protein n=1 Tax=Nocardia farcinica (strain IFM 10152) TaxID=247156 RepID=Q5YQL1_NOCFA|nr:hypothetical protein [Nocardia farcinica]BAD59530.1 hypothetical protein NFA_46790 [Nocardia farcinica IFM 10152]